ncbi:MAG: putative ABC exporter domain-containing protein [Gemmatimonadaceae bacterium]
MIVDAYWFLTAHTMRNRLVSQLKRVKEPRYAVASLLGLLYVFSIYSQHSGGTGGGLPNDLFRSPASLLLIASTCVAMLVAGWWIFGGDRSALAFTPAEVHFLFAAPLSRRSLIQFKLLRAQPQIIVSTLVWIVLLRRGGESPLPMLCRALAFYIVFATLLMHRLGASLVRSTAAENGGSGARRSALPLAIVLAGLAGLAWSVLAALPKLRHANGDFLPILRQALSGTLPSVVLAPVRWTLAPTMSSTVPEWAVAMLPALAMLALHYLWVIRTQVAFEETAMEATTKRAERLAVRRARRSGASVVEPVVAGSRAIPLAPTGEPAIAIVWKNSTYFWRTMGKRTLVLVVLIAIISVVIAAMFGSRDEQTGQYGQSALGPILIMFTMLFTLMGPTYIRNDLRLDLQQLDLLRTFPVDPVRLVGAEIASSVIALSALELAFVAVLYLSLLFVPQWTPFSLSLGERTLALIAFATAIPLLNAVTLTVQNGVALLFPAWVRPGSTGGGIESIGQNLLAMIASFFLLALSWIAPAFAVGAVLWTLWAMLGRWSIGLAVVAGGSVIVLEVWLVMTWLAGVLTKTEKIDE